MIIPKCTSHLNMKRNKIKPMKTKQTKNIKPTRNGL